MVIYLLLIYFLLANDLRNLNIYQSEIKLVVKGNGLQYFLNDTLYLDPSEIIINGIVNTSCKKYCYLENDLNYITIRFPILIESGENMFNGLDNIIEIDISNLNTSKITNMESMFNQCSNLEKINLGNIDTSLVENMNNLFYNCCKLESIDLSNFDTSNVKYMNQMFCSCESLLTINVSNFKTSKVEEIANIFSNCYKLYTIDVSNFDTKNVKNMKGMFENDHNLRYIDLSNFDTSSVTNMQHLFFNCESLIYINIYSFTIPKIETIHYSFIGTPETVAICQKNRFIQGYLDNTLKNYNCDDPCFKDNKKIDFNKNICIKSCENYEYNNICFDKCPYKTFPLFNDSLCLDKNPEGYYLDGNFYKKCGDEPNNNCTDCISGFILLNEPNIKNKCYYQCDFFYYINDLNNSFSCTKNNSCPSNYKNFIPEKI